MAATATGRKLLLDGEWIETGEWLEVRSPYDGSVVGRVALPVRTSPHNLRYLRTKRDRMGHDLPHLDDGGIDVGQGTSVVDSAGS